jgi:type II secretory pathway pseudopilin PulG
MPGRARNSGFVLWDVLIAFAIVALALATIMVSLPQTSVRQTERVQRHEAAEFAYSKLEEYRVTYPLVQTSGDDLSGWSWAIVERPVDPTSTDGLILLIEAEVTAWPTDRPDLRATLKSTVARRNGQ